MPTTLLRIVCLATLLLAAPAAIAGDAKSPAAEVSAAQASDAELAAKMDEAWKVSWERFFDPRTNLFYDRVSSYEPAQRFATLPTLAEIAQLNPNHNGWGTGMEDCAISGGLLMAMVCDRHAVTGEASLRASATRIFRGLVLLGTVSSSPGFVARGVSPLDCLAHYDESSRDQYTWYVYGLWRYCRSPLSSPAEREQARQLVAAVCQRLERNCVAERGYRIGREGGSAESIVDSMWNNAAHEIARLPMIYAIGADLTADRHWADLAEKYAPEAAERSAGESTKIPYALLQQQVSLEALYELEKSPERKARWLECMKLVAGRSHFALPFARQYKPLDLATLDMDWRNWPIVLSMGYRVPQMPQACRQEDRTVRQPAEAALTQFLLPQPQLTPEQLALVRQGLAQVDNTKAVTYGLYYTQAAYWRGARQGLFKAATPK